ENVEALVYPLEAMRVPNYFLYKAIHRGGEVYRMEEEELRQQEVRNLLNLAEEYLEGSREILEAKRFRIACDVAYNAVELCAKGLLLLEMEELPGAHGGIIGEFGRWYVRPGKATREIGRRLNRGLELRNKARYDFNIRVLREEAEGITGLAEEMAQLLEKKLG
ncbi:MAG: HEPN domain-containing protein, partial [Desulfobacterales bacterium]|nr:HEPN domain-containing protein [Desulfobacterales bacterium]